MNRRSGRCCTACVGAILIHAACFSAASAGGLPKILVAPDGGGFVTDRGEPFVPFGVNYFVPGTGWAPQVWKQFDEEVARNTLRTLKSMGGNCVRVFLTFGSFAMEPDRLLDEGVEKLDRFLAIAEDLGIYVHPTGPDHWEGVPEWARHDRVADEKVLFALDRFWTHLAARYRGRGVIFAYDLRNEPTVPWATSAMQARWRAWLSETYGTADGIEAAWGRPAGSIRIDEIRVPDRETARGRELLDFQILREDVAVEWTRRQVAAIKAADPGALATIGLIQWSVPVGFKDPGQYSAFNPSRIAPLLDFMEIHFYPLATGFYAYQGDEAEGRNLAYLELVMREIAGYGKPAVLAEFGWYGGGKLSPHQGDRPPATEAQQAQWVRRAIESTVGLSNGWLYWSFFDYPGARDVSELMGLLTSDGREKEAGRAFRELAETLRGTPAMPRRIGPRPTLDWPRMLVEPVERMAARDRYHEAWAVDR